MGMSPSKPKPPPPPPSTPTKAQAEQFVAGSPRAAGAVGGPSLVNTGSQGLLSRADTRKRSLIGGGLP